jgi:hypothetical protein
MVFIKKQTKKSSSSSSSSSSFGLLLGFFRVKKKQIQGFQKVSAEAEEGG